MRSKPYGDPSMGLSWPRSERYGAQGPPWLYPQKVQSRAVTLLGERPTGQKRTQRAASLILGQPPRGGVVPRCPAGALAQGRDDLVPGPVVAPLRKVVIDSAL